MCVIFCVTFSLKLMLHFSVEKDTKCGCSALQKQICSHGHEIGAMCTITLRSDLNAAADGRTLDLILLSFLRPEITDN